MLEKRSHFYLLAYSGEHSLG